MSDSAAQQLRVQIAELVGRYAQLQMAPKPFVAGQDSVPPSGKVIGAPELQAMTEAVLDGWLTTGRFNAEFEKKLAEFIGVKFLLSVNSGSSANLVAFSTLTSPKLGERAIKKGDEVIGVAAGFPTTVNPIVQFGAIPVFDWINGPAGQQLGTGDTSVPRTLPEPDYPLGILASIAAGLVHPPALEPSQQLMQQLVIHPAKHFQGC